MSKPSKSSFIYRSAASFFMVVLLFFVCGVRLVTVNLGQYASTAAEQASYQLQVYRHRGTIFDRNGQPLTNIPDQFTAAVVSTPAALSAMESVLSAADYSSISGSLASGRPILVNLSSNLQTDGITVFRAYNRYSGLAPHLVGYLDSSAHGAAGIEAAWDTTLYSHNTTSLTYTCDAYGRVLPGVAPVINGEQNTAVEDGVALTLDSRIQKIVQEETADMGCGAAVVVDVKNGEILASHSFPAYDQYNPAAALGSSDSPFMNRVLTNYNAGSVFKSFVAAAALESGADPHITYHCSGGMEVSGINFTCNRSAGHLEMDLSTALAKSCNVYFYNLALGCDPETLLSTAEKMGFLRANTLTSGIGSPAGVLPSLSKLTASPAAVANFAIGQGDVMISPLNLAMAYAAIANGGTLYQPTLIAGVVRSGQFTPTVPSEGERVLSSSTCHVLNEALKLAVTDGTGTSAQPQYYAAAGKTATAQTGWKKDGRAVLISWFAGYFPADSPEYAIVIMKEGGTSGSADCAPVFKRIADRICHIS